MLYPENGAQPIPVLMNVTVNCHQDGGKPCSMSYESTHVHQCTVLAWNGGHLLNLVDHLDGEILKE